MPPGQVTTLRNVRYAGTEDFIPGRRVQPSWSLCVSAVRHGWLALDALTVWYRGGHVAVGAPCGMDRGGYRMTSAQPSSIEMRLRRRDDYARVYDAGCSAGDESLVVYVAANSLDWSRFGLSVGKRLGNAVARNRVRRILREAFRLARPDLPSGLDIVCVAKPAALSHQPYLSASLRRLVVKARNRADRDARRPPRQDHPSHRNPKGQNTDQRLPGK